MNMYKHISVGPFFEAATCKTVEPKDRCEFTEKKRNVSKMSIVSFSQRKRPRRSDLCFLNGDAEKVEMFGAHRIGFK